MISRLSVASAGNHWQGKTIKTSLTLSEGVKRLKKLEILRLQEQLATLESCLQVCGRIHPAHSEGCKLLVITNFGTNLVCCESVIRHG